MKLDWNSITTGVVVIVIAYLVLSMLKGGAQGSASVSVDPAISVDLGNSGVGSVGGDFVGMYSANLTGVLKLTTHGLFIMVQNLLRPFCINLIKPINKTVFIRLN